MTYLCEPHPDIAGSLVAQSSGQAPFTSEFVGSNLGSDSLHSCEKSWSTLCQKSWVFSRYSGFLLIYSIFLDKCSSCVKGKDALEIYNKLCNDFDYGKYGKSLCLDSELYNYLE